MRLGIVRDDHLVLIGRMREVVKDPLLLHDAGGKIEVRFTILNAIVFWLVCTLGLYLEVVTLQNDLEDLLDVFILEYTALLRLREHPQLRFDLHGIGRKPSLVTISLRKPAYHSMEVPFGCSVALNQLYDDGFSQYVFRIDDGRRPGLGFFLVSNLDLVAE